MKKLTFRADGNAQIGMGHVMRCLALADMLKSEFSMQFAITEPDHSVRSLVEQAGLSVVTLPNSENQSFFLSQIHPEDIVVVDGYSFDETAQRSIRGRAKKLVFIDDLITGHQVADVVINHAGGVTSQDYDAEAYTQFCLGPYYALLRPEFLRSEGFGTFPDDGHIFVSLGGADSQNVSLTVLKAIQQVNAGLPVHLVLGPFHPNRPAIEAFQSQLTNLTILQNLTASQMVNEIQGCRLAITSCSTISYEVCAVNRPLIGIVTAENQDRLAGFLAEEKLALSVNFPTLLTRLTPVLALDQMLKLAIQSFTFSPEMIAQTVTNQGRFFDGRSPERFRKLFQELSA
ncbi:UDP-2,4-diacetamido-2,4,6-trideoxy-beta-L-altropyranose hydrolase [Spirosoma sp. BT702]|uniref:UDP-2,4-diacetamido-2,4, 6-trideoxy-beta-L-altropyranose hydrolase n=1 Tax=Spirosoma profusum TaxID=2771354 RepID=A0A926Y3T5_9BACT|nr:UDP-2,4-diacetamido-2,4,6-trideoxy-beta-L-altropyranose hydrolase [Spirosoma profusum]MBD2703683.1 UDP-2,4-diacetamido-2,4,6-trideoxy-beta-L-altropyranose hydrolase [Spirosoma profusum]